MRSALPGRHADGNGLYLFVQLSGTRSWIQRLVIRGRRSELGLGSVALVSLAEAREQARANRKLARQGGDPLAKKRRAQGIPSFAEAAVTVIEQKQGGWRDPTCSWAWMSSLERYGEVRGARWGEMDTENRVWIIPARRMKMKRDHRVSLCGRAMEIVEAARRLGDGGSPLVFPNENGKRLDDKRLRRMLEKHRIAAVPHGFRSSFRNWATEETDHPREVIEAAYARSDLFERRRNLMADWAAYLSGAPGLGIPTNVDRCSQ